MLDVQRHAELARTRQSELSQLEKELKAAKESVDALLRELCARGGRGGAAQTGLDNAVEAQRLLQALSTARAQANAAQNGTPPRARRRHDAHSDERAHAQDGANVWRFMIDAMKKQLP